MTDPYTFKSLPYDPMKDFTVISRIAEVTFMVLAHPDVPAKNLPELFAYAKANPDKLAVATDGARRFSGMIAAWLNKLAGTQDFLRALHADDAGHSGRARRPRAARHHRRAGRQGTCRGRQAPRAGGDVARSGCRSFPDVPAVAETFPGFDFAGWFVLAAPTGVPGRSSQRVNREMDGILKDPAVVETAGAMSGFVSRRRRHAEGGAATTCRASTRPGARW